MNVTRIKTINIALLLLTSVRQMIIWSKNALKVASVWTQLEH